MNKSESKYFNTAIRMDEALLKLLEEKDFAYISVKEICEKAEVNRSTFYLHYESMMDLLGESVAYRNRQFASYFSKEATFDVKTIRTADLEALYLITPQYLLPFLRYIRDHRRLFQTVMEKSAIFAPDDYLRRLFNEIFSPIMDRYHVPETKKPFLLAFTIDGIIGIIKVWLKGDCREPMEWIADIILESI